MARKQQTGSSRAAETPDLAPDAGERGLRAALEVVYLRLQIPSAGFEDECAHVLGPRGDGLEAFIQGAGPAFGGVLLCSRCEEGQGWEGGHVDLQ